MSDPRESLDSISIPDDEGTLDPTLPEIGDVVAGKYQIEELLGKGGMGVVVVARHLELGKRVALKFLLPEAAELPNAVARFMREARASVSLESDYVAKVEDVGKLATGMPYMVMELLTGEDLGAVLRERERLPIDEAIDLFLQACIAVAEAHALGIIHRDIKPSNLFLARRRDGSVRVKVLDFGLVKVTDDAHQPVGDNSLTTAEMIAGSPQYQSPEQFRSLKDVTRRADIWSLGVVLYRMLTGKRPFNGPNLTAICVSVATDDPPPPTEHRPDIPAEVSDAILCCLEKNEADRFDNVGQLARALAPFGTERCDRLAAQAETAGGAVPSYDSLPRSRSSARSQRTSTPTAPTLAKSTWEKKDEAAGGSRWAVALAAFVLLGGGAIWWFTQPAPAPPQPAGATTPTAQPAPSPTPSAKPAPPASATAAPSASSSASAAATSPRAPAHRPRAQPPKAEPKAEPKPRPRGGGGREPPSDPLDEWQ